MAESAGPALACQEKGKKEGRVEGLWKGNKTFDGVLLPSHFCEQVSIGF